MRLVSLNLRLAQDAPSSDKIEAALFVIEHPDLEAPIRLSSDNTERLSEDPLYYGTRSTWRGADPTTDPYLWVVASAVLPGDDEEAPASATVVLHNLDARMIGILRSITAPATVHMAVVLADAPDLIEAEWLDNRLTGFDATAGEIAIQIGREEIEQEHFPAGRLTRNRFPGLHP